MSSFGLVRRPDPQVGRLALVSLLMQSGNQASYFVGLIGTATYVLGADAFGISVLVGVINLCYVMGSGFIGVIVDRLGPRVVLTGTLLAHALVALVALLIPTWFWSLVLVAGALAFLSGSSSTTIQSFPPYVVEGRNELKDANSLIDTAVHLAFVIGPAAGGALSGLWSTKVVFAFTALCLATATFVSLGLSQRFEPTRGKAGQGEANDSDSSSIAEFADGALLVFRDRTLRVLFAIGFLGFFAFGAFDSLESIYYRDVLGVSVSWMGWLSMLSGVGAIVGSALLLRIPASRVDLGLLAKALLLTGMGTMLYVGTTILGVAAVGQLATGLGFGLMMPLQHLLVQESCELSYMGRVTGVMRVGLNSSGVLPLLVSPFLARIVGVQAVLFCAACLVAVVGVVFVVRER